MLDLHYTYSTIGLFTHNYVNDIYASYLQPANIFRADCLFVVQAYSRGCACSELPQDQCRSPRKTEGNTGLALFKQK